MGLDMYLTERVYIGQEYEHRKITGALSIYQDGKEICSGIEKLSEVIYTVAYWRKANHIHQWFVANVQDGVDECEETWVGIDQLRELDAICAQVLADHDLAAERLPTQEGFFFGGTEYDEYYFSGLEETRRMLKSVLDHDRTYRDIVEHSLYYRSSW